MGRVAVEVAGLLIGKKKPTYTPNVDCGDFVIVVNADKVELTGNKWEDKKYYHHSRFFGGLKEFSAKEMMQRDPTYMITEAVRGMLPKNKLARHMITKLKAYAGTVHPHSSQKPEAWSLTKKN